MSPWTKFERWYQEAVAKREPEANAMTLATSGEKGHPAARIVLYKKIGPRDRIHFFTNYTSHKAREITAHPHVALVFFWPSLGKQIRIEGRVSKAPARISEMYWITRPRESQLGAWASKQSQTMQTRKQLEQRYAAYETEFSGQPVPRPPHWGGYVVTPKRFEFWKAETGRLHQRESFDKKGSRWTRTLLFP